MTQPKGYPLDSKVVAYLRKAAGESIVYREAPRYKHIVWLADSIGVSPATLRKVLQQVPDEHGNAPSFSDKTHAKINDWLRDNQSDLAHHADNWRRPKFKNTKRIRESIAKKRFRP